MEKNNNREKKPREKGKFDVRKVLVPILMAVLAVLLVITVALFGDDSGGKIVDPSPKSAVFYEYFDTVGRIYSFVGDSENTFRGNTLIVENTLKEYHELFDIYNDHEYVTGLYEINKNAGVAPVKVSDELIEFLDFCIEAYEITNGEVNIAMGAVLRLWKEYRTNEEKNPSAAEPPSREVLETAAEHCDIEKIIIDRENFTVYLSDSEMSIDVGAIGKGYAAEKAAERLKEQGVTGYALDIGGNVRIIGEKPSGAPFKTGIKDPSGNDPDGYSEIIELKNTSAVTSGEYERGDHIIDKDTLSSPSYFASVTVVTENSGLADALSTALYCMDREEGLALAESIGDIKVIWVYEDGSVVKYE